jgi:hypothetical protein
MSPSSLRSLGARILSALCLAVLALAACGDAREAQIRARAQSWVDRQYDTVKTDSLAPSEPDSALVDSISAAWTTEDWVRFWDEVEKAQARRKK